MARANCSVRRSCSANSLPLSSVIVLRPGFWLPFRKCPLHGVSDGTGLERVAYLPAARYGPRTCVRPKSRRLLGGGYRQRYRLPSRRSGGGSPTTLRPPGDINAMGDLPAFFRHGAFLAPVSEKVFPMKAAVFILVDPGVNGLSCEMLPSRLSRKYFPGPGRRFDRETSTWLNRHGQNG